MAFRQKIRPLLLCDLIALATRASVELLGTSLHTGAPTGAPQGEREQ